jgi:glycosyltransferase involved in cell wall biosynthesis
LFAAAEAVRRVNRQLATRGLPLKLKLTTAGNFVTVEEQTEFDQLRQQPEFAGIIEHLGFVSGAQKELLLRTSDLFLFPTRYLGENQPVNLIEAMAFGLPIVTTRWRSLPEMLPPHYPGLVDDQDPDKIAAAILLVLGEKSSEQGRENFVTRFTLERHLADLAAALRSVDAGETTDRQAAQAAKF